MWIDESPSRVWDSRIINVDRGDWFQAYLFALRRLFSWIRNLRNLSLARSSFDFPYRLLQGNHVYRIKVHRDSFFASPISRRRVRNCSSNVRRDNGPKVMIARFENYRARMFRFCFTVRNGNRRVFSWSAGRFEKITEWSSARRYKLFTKYERIIWNYYIGNRYLIIGTFP